MSKCLGIISGTEEDRRQWYPVAHTIKRETFEGENFRKCQGSVAIHESFSSQNLGAWHLLAASASNSHKNFLSESYPLYGNPSNDSRDVVSFDGLT